MFYNIHTKCPDVKRMSAYLADVADMRLTLPNLRISTYQYLHLHHQMIGLIVIERLDSIRCDYGRGPMRCYDAIRIR
jgi:hypothetical protein